MSNIERLKTFFVKIFIPTLLIAILAIAAPSHAAIRTVAGTVTKVSDGDTIHLTTSEQTKLKVRLYGIDAPETPKINNRKGKVSKPGQPYGVESWHALRDNVDGKAG